MTDLERSECQLRLTILALLSLARSLPQPLVLHPPEQPIRDQYELVSTNEKRELPDNLTKIKSLAGLRIQQFTKQFLSSAGERFEVLGYFAAPLLPPGAELLKVRISSVSFLPGQHSQQTEEHHDTKLEDILDSVHLIVLIGVFGHQFRGAVGKQFILLDDNVTLMTNSSEITKFDECKIRFEHKNIVQLHIQVTQVLTVDPLQR